VTANSFTNSFDLLVRTTKIPIIVASLEGDHRELSAAELDSVFEEAADLIPAGTPSRSDEALSRETIYTREDEWNTNRRC
jgi:hypothetical protein